MARVLAIDIGGTLAGADAPVDAVVIAAFWHSLTGVDVRGRPVTGALPWADTRAASEIDALSEEVDEGLIHARTGCRLHSSYWPARLRWFRRHDAKTFRRVRRRSPEYLPDATLAIVGLRLATTVDDIVRAGHASRLGPVLT